MPRPTTVFPPEDVAAAAAAAGDGGAAAPAVDVPAAPCCCCAGTWLPAADHPSLLRIVRAVWGLLAPAADPAGLLPNLAAALRPGGAAGNTVRQGCKRGGL